MTAKPTGLGGVINQRLTGYQTMLVGLGGYEMAHKGGYHPPKAELNVGSPVCQCPDPECGLYFTGVQGFDMHLLPDGDDVRCMTVAEMRRIGMTPNVHGVWARGQATGKGTGRKRGRAA